MLALSTAPKSAPKKTLKPNAAPTLTNKIFEALNRVFQLSTNDDSYDAQPSVKLARVLGDGVESFIAECQGDDYLSNLPDDKLRALFTKEFLLEKVAEKLQPKQRKRSDKGTSRSNTLLGIGDNDNETETAGAEGSQVGEKRKRGRRMKGDPVNPANSVTTKKKQLRLRLQTLEEKIKDVLLLKNDLWDCLRNESGTEQPRGSSSSQHSNRSTSTSASTNSGVQESAIALSGMAVPPGISGSMPLTLASFNTALNAAPPMPMPRLNGTSTSSSGVNANPERLEELDYDITRKEEELSILYKERAQLEQGSATSQQSKIVILCLDPAGETFMKGLFNASDAITETEARRADAWVDLSKAYWGVSGDTNANNGGVE